jgi:hypothetical protein
MIAPRRLRRWASGALALALLAAIARDAPAQNAAPSASPPAQPAQAPAASPPPPAAPPATPRTTPQRLGTIRVFQVTGTTFRLTTGDGTVLTSRDLVGAVFSVGDERGRGLTFRIDAVEPAPDDPDGDVMLHRFSVRDPSTDRWEEMCDPDQYGRRVGFPLSGTWNEAGEHIESEREFSLTCTSGALGKCVIFGYKPWRSAADGTPLAPYHQACTRAVRADYCGNGQPYTHDGTVIDIYDRLNIQRRDEIPDMSFEAAWSPAGAVCVRRTRIPAAMTIEGLATMCRRLDPSRLGERCTEQSGTRDGAILFNRSY